MPKKFKSEKIGGVLCCAVCGGMPDLNECEYIDDKVVVCNEACLSVFNGDTALLSRADDYG